MSPSRPDTFEQWVAAARPQLVRLATHLLKDPGEAENVVQATLLAVWEAHVAGEAADLDAYAKRAVWLNAMRRRARWREWEGLEEAPEEAVATGAPDEELSAWELEEALQGLPQAQQLVLRMRFYGGMSFKEIGHALSISLNTAASRARYGLEALRSAFSKSESNEVSEEQNDG